jgi:hypothetical protein
MDDRASIRHEDEIIYKQMLLDRRLRMASALEVTFYGFALTVLFVRETLTRPARSTEELILLLTSPQALVVGTVIFILILVFLLTGTAPFVGVVRTMISVVRSSGSVSEALVQGFRDTIEVVTARRNAIQHLKQATSVAVDDIETRFLDYLERSQEAVRAAQRRPNALLFVGAFIAALGLIFFLLTLPGAPYGVVDSTPSTVDLKTDFWSSAIQLFPRLLMLIFIQVLAGFFLRQYRSAMEDFRYYEAILRHREAQYLSYSLRKKLGEKKALLAFADELLKEPEFGRLSAGQTTAVLEAQKAEANEFSSLYERFASALARFEDVTKRRRKQKT